MQAVVFYGLFPQSQPPLRGLEMFYSTITKPEYFFLHSWLLRLWRIEQEISAASHDDTRLVCRNGIICYH